MEVDSIGTASFRAGARGWGRRGGKGSGLRRNAIIGGPESGLVKKERMCRREREEEETPGDQSGRSKQIGRGKCGRTTSMPVCLLFCLSFPRKLSFPLAQWVERRAAFKGCSMLFYRFVSSACPWRCQGQSALAGVSLSIDWHRGGVHPS